MNNPITRKQGYRSLLICKCPKLYTADGQVITFEEREYADGMLSSSSMQTAAHVVGADGMGLGLAGKQGQVSEEARASAAFPAGERARAVRTAVMRPSTGLTPKRVCACGGAAAPQAVRLTNLDFASLAAAASQFGQVPGARQGRRVARPCLRGGSVQPGVVCGRTPGAQLAWCRPSPRA